MKSIAIMQPYFFPYIGYFQLIQSVDQFIVYDNIKYTKKGWINRNRLLRDGQDVLFSIPLKKDSDFLDIKDREIAADFNRTKFLNQFKEAYRSAPYFEPVFDLIKTVITTKESNLFQFIYNSIIKVCGYLSIDTEILVSSTLTGDNSLQGSDKVIAICKHQEAGIYINAIGGQELYSKDEFHAQNLQLKFLKSKFFDYTQFNNDFVPWLSIIDVMMFNSKDQLINIIRHNYELI
jgi:WbqC-like protein family